MIEPLRSVTRVGQAYTVLAHMDWFCQSAVR